METAATNILKDEDGAVSGVMAVDKNGEEVKVDCKARSSVPEAQAAIRK